MPPCKKVRNIYGVNCKYLLVTNITIALIAITRKIMYDRIIIITNNVGYEIYMPENELQILEEKTEEVEIYTYLHVREDDMKLFGFLKIETLEFFKKLITVSGVGAKVALSIISNIDKTDMCVAIATDDIATLKSVPGIGPKMAQKIIFELKDKILKEEIDTVNSSKKRKTIENPNIDEATAALQVLGYSIKTIKEIIEKLSVENDGVEDIIRKVLKEMQKN